MSSQSPPFDATDTTANWSSISKHVLNSYVEANNAVLAAMGLTPRSTDDPGPLDEATVTDPDVSDVSYGDERWTLERSTDDYAALGVGDFVRFSKPIRNADVSAFAQVSGDTNRLHLEEEFAGQTQFGGRIAHGTLVAGTISAALARLPGLTVYLSQDLEFHAPVEIGDIVTAECEIVEDLGDRRYRLRTAVTAEDDRTVIDGEAVVLIEEPPEA
ncbi:MaoC family dehydratase [Halopiger goleimassiliensis]|uniref:MaoC family dehydratase n=1 Tax=Halopiger goleimassiliensis TaxID=1293048 RepID=UPI000677898A|nr:MaoC family dehydratase [Halopiger goleimassiliensis]